MTIIDRRGFLAAIAALPFVGVGLAERLEALAGPASVPVGNLYFDRVEGQWLAWSPGSTSPPERLTLPARSLYWTRDGAPPYFFEEIATYEAGVLHIVCWNADLFYEKYAHLDGEAYFRLTDAAHWQHLDAEERALMGVNGLPDWDRRPTGDRAERWVVDPLDVLADDPLEGVFVRWDYDRPLPG